MSWIEVPHGANASKPFATVEDQYLRMSASLAKFFEGVGRVDRLVDGRRLGLRPSESGVKLCRPRSGTHRQRILVAAGQIIREFRLMNGDRLELVGIEDGIYILEATAPRGW